MSLTGFLRTTVEMSIRRLFLQNADRDASPRMVERNQTVADQHTSNPVYVYGFTEGNKDMKDLLGGKGANLAEMTRLGLPVPPGFTITTQACRVYLEHGGEPAEMAAQVDAHLTRLEEEKGQKLGDSADPLLVSVRSGAKFSMPGMMETVLDIGLNDETVHGLAARAKDEHFAWDSYRRLIQMFGKTVLGIDGDLFEEALEHEKAQDHVSSDIDLSVDHLKHLVYAYKIIIKKEAGIDFPQDPRQQVEMAIRAVFDSWNTERAKLYRRQERIPHDLGTAVNVQAMAFGNVGEGSGTGVAFTRDPSTGAKGIYGDYLPDAQGEDVVAGIRNTLPLESLRELDPASYEQLADIMHTLETHYRDLCDIEFTIERGKLWMLQTRVGKRTAAAAFRIATQLVDEGLIDMDEAVRRVNGQQLARLMFPQFDRAGSVDLLAKGMNASPGAAVGKVVFDSAVAADWASAWRGRHPRPPGNQSRRPARHGCCCWHSDQPWRQNLPCRRGRSRYGQDRGLWCRGTSGRHCCADHDHRHGSGPQARRGRQHRWQYR